MKPRPGKLLVVGAGGFLGPWISQAALDGGWEVVGLARTPLAAPGGAQNFTGVLADAADISSCRRWLDECDAVIFNAAYIPADHSAAEAEACVDFNALVPGLYLQELIARPRPFIYISGAQGYRPRGQLATEQDLLFPAGHAAYYLASKLLGDIITEHHRLVHGVPTTVLRAGSLYGPGQRRGMVARFIQQAKTGDRLVLSEGGRHSADLTFVGDVAAAALASLATGSSGIYNVGSGRGTSALEAARMILAAAGRDESLLEIRPAGTGPAGGFAALDVTRARADLGLRPTPPEVGLVRAVREWRDLPVGPTP